ncbi:MAG: CBS domain-containing protein, partial [bacterium]|nr:CBS domain-containing protein [bacterium]
MADLHDSAKAHDSTEDNLDRVVTLLRKHHLVKNLVHKQDMPRHDLVESLVQKQHLAELHALLDDMHPADVARVLEALPLDDRLLVWDLVKAEHDGEILLEVSDAVRGSLIKSMDSDELLAAAETLDTDEIADLAPDLPQDVIEDLLDSLDAQNRARLQSALSYPEDTVGALMDYDMVTIRADVTLVVALRYLRRLGELPDQTDKLFVVDRDGGLKGVMPLQRLLLQSPDANVSDVMAAEVVTFRPEDEATDAAQAFERYDLLSAPVIDGRNRLMGRLTVNAVVDYIRQESDSDRLSIAGLREDEDIFASVWKSV